MPTLDEANKRRSSRVFIRIPVKAKGRNLQGRTFQVATETVVVNAHGGLLYLEETMSMGSEIVISNPVTDEELECRVVFIGAASEKGQRVGVEFLSPAPHFWGVEFPQDWTRKDSAAGAGQPN